MTPWKRTSIIYSSVHILEKLTLPPAGPEMVPFFLIFVRWVPPYFLTFPFNDEMHIDLSGFTFCTIGGSQSYIQQD